MGLGIVVKVLVICGTVFFAGGDQARMMMLVVDLLGVILILNGTC